MSMPNIPNISPNINLNREDIVNLLLASVALEEIGLGHILNAEGEKLQAVLAAEKCKGIDISAIKDINESVERTVNGIARMQMMLQMKMENILRFTTTTTSTTTASTSTSSTHSTCTQSTTHSCSATATQTTTKTCSTTRSSTCAPSTTTPCIHSFQLTGYGEGYTVEEKTGEKYGIARIKADIDTSRQDVLKNTLKYRARRSAEAKSQTIELRMIPSSMKIEYGAMPFGEKNGGMVIVRGSGILGGGCVPPETQIQKDFCLQVAGEGKELTFRMQFDLPNSPDHHDSGPVSLVSGNLSWI